MNNNHAVRQELCRLFPRTFMPAHEPKAPLKVGIFREIRERAPQIKARELKDALRDYCMGTTYLRNLVAGAARLGLDGEPAGFVEQSDADHARRILAGRGMPNLPPNFAAKSEAA